MKEMSMSNQREVRAIPGIADLRFFIPYGVWAGVVALSLFLLCGDCLEAAGLTGDLLGGVGRSAHPPRFEALWKEGTSFEARVRCRFFYFDFFASGRMWRLHADRDGLRGVLGISPSTTVSIDGEDLEILSAGVGIILNLRKSGLINPYLRFGLSRYWYGAAEVTVSGAEEERVEPLSKEVARFGGDLGLGLELQASRRCTFIFEGGRHMADLESPAEMFHLMVFTAGINLRGGR